MKNRLVLRALVMLAVARAAPAQSMAPRSVEQAVHSAANPAADIVVDPTFTFLGRVGATVMDGRATAEQYWFVKVEGGRIARMVVVHFEHWNEGNPGSFEYPTLRMRRLGGHDYLHQSFPMEAGCGIATPDVRTRMREAGFALAKECIGTRFVRAVSGDRRHEMILFYLQPVDALPSTEGLAPGGLPVGYDRPQPPETPWAATDRRLTEEALRAIQVRDRP